MLNDLIKAKNNNDIFIKKFSFSSKSPKDGYINLTEATLYNSELGYGFVTEKVKEDNLDLQIPELSSGFDINQSLAGHSLTNIIVDDSAFSDKPGVRLYFRLKVPGAGNYNVKLTIGNSNSDSVVTVFSERRRCVLRNVVLKAGEFMDHTFTANVCDIIPRGKTEAYHDDALDIVIIGQNAGITELIVREAKETPTIYIAGDSTVTDQSAQYPYDPAVSYCGWAQMFPMFLSEGLSVSNHAHSGLTTSSFKREGHWNIVDLNIKENDLFFIQFGHNDQKDKSLDPFGGYSDNLRTYVDEIRNKGAKPIIVTPVSRTIWNGPNGSFNDMLIDYSNACKEVAREKGVPLIDLHDKSVDFILKHGPTASIKYFYPKDWTHHNDYGGYEMAKLVVEAIKQENIMPIVKYLKEADRDLIHEEQLSSWKEPSQENVQEQYKQWLKANQWAQEFVMPDLKDTTNHWAKTSIEKVVQFGIMKGMEGEFLPDKALIRVEFYEILLKAFKYSPTNVYNDMFEDVFGDEWYAGIVQAAYDNALIPNEAIKDKKFYPLQPLILEDAINIIKNAYKAKFNEDYLIRKDLKQLNPKNITTRASAAVLIISLLDKFK
jgi:lysophospholipase L1-like esterase